MIQDFLNKIETLQIEVESALNESDFDKLAKASNELETSVDTFLSTSNIKNSIKEEELVYLQNLLANIQKYQQETSLKFKNYTLEVSRKRKMHQAYKQ
tara:strand:+ start:143 stop:436 length:294 start_codon:yes stop_codon:yes gene_type:complete